MNEPCQVETGPGDFPNEKNGTTVADTDNPRLTSKFSEATSYALGKHRLQIRKGSDVPYASHVLSVAAITLEMGSDEEEAIAALLHDVAEDQGGAEAEAEIRERFGDRVADMVRANSDTYAADKPPWHARKEAYIAGVGTKDIGAVRVSIADKLHNARMIVFDHRQVGDALWERFTASATDTLWYYESLVAAFDARRDELGAGGAAALDELSRTVGEMRAAVMG